MNIIKKLFPNRLSDDGLNDLSVEIFAPVLTRMTETILRSNIEEGGKLLGKVAQRGSRLIITVETYIDSGPRVDNSTGHLLPDGEHQENLFRIIEGYDPDIEHIGSWHSHHCNGHPELSSGDIRGYLNSVNSPNYNLNVFFALLVTRVQNHRVQARYYLFQRGDQECRELDERRIQIVNRSYPFDGVLREAERATINYRGVPGFHDREVSERTTHRAPKDSLEQFLMAVRREDKSWLSQHYPMAKTIRDIRDGTISWKWTVPVHAKSLQVVFAYPSFAESMETANASLKISIENRLLGTSEIKLDEFRFQEIEKQIEKATRVVANGEPFWKNRRDYDC